MQYSTHKIVGSRKVLRYPFCFSRHMRNKTILSVSVFSFSIQQSLFVHFCVSQSRAVRFKSHKLFLSSALTNANSKETISDCFCELINESFDWQNIICLLSVVAESSGRRKVVGSFFTIYRFFYSRRCCDSSVSGTS